MAAKDLYIGIMSGTSADGVDTALVEIDSEGTRQLATAYTSFASALRKQILAMNLPQQDELHKAAMLANELTRTYAESVSLLLGKEGISGREVKAIGCHGQTVRHHPELGYSQQLINGALLAELTGITTICDFRSRDIAAGGQGAPLVPAFHEAAFRSANRHRVIVNIGGIANLTNLPLDGPVTGFDTGPGNMLLDAWSMTHLGKPYDENGAWARRGHVQAELLSLLRADPYFRKLPPKSTGRENFGLPWLESSLRKGIAPADVQATLVALTADSIADAIATQCKGAEEVFVCGGGVHNALLMETLAAAICDASVNVTDELGIGADWVEACAFAWLAHRADTGAYGNLSAVTGAAGPRVLGAIYRF